MTIFSHGNWCGANWSDARSTTSVHGFAPSVDEFDETCRQHDFGYAEGRYQEADEQFLRDNFGKGILRSTVGLGVYGYNYLARGLSAPLENMTKRKASTQPVIKNNNPIKRAKTASNTTPVMRAITTSVPASYGTSLRITAPKITRMGNTAIISGSDYGGTVYTTNSTNFQPSASIPLNPAYFNNAMLGSLSRAFEKYRFKKCIVEFVPSAPTSTTGQIYLCSTRTIKEPFLDGTTSSFLSRVLSQHNAVATPIWLGTTINIDCTQEWSVVDALIDGDLDDTVSEEVQVYALANSTASVGVLLVHYIIEFKDPLYTYHATSIPISVGIGSLASLTDRVAINAITDSVSLVNSTVSLDLGSGSIYRAIFIQGRSTLPTGPASWATVARVASATNASQTTNYLTYSNITMTPGTTLFLKLNDTHAELYNSYDSAVAGSLSGSIFYQTATTAAGTWVFLLAAVRLGDTRMLISQ